MITVRWSAAFDAPATVSLVRALDARGVRVTADHRGAADIRDIPLADRLWLTGRPHARTQADVQVIDLAAVSVHAARGTAPCAIRLGPGLPASVDLAGISLLDDLWARSSDAHDTLIALGVSEKRIWVCPDPVWQPTRPIAPETVPGAHGTVMFAEADAVSVGPLLALWGRTFAPTDDITLILVPGNGETGLSAAAHAALSDGAAIADVVLVDQPVGREQRLAMMLASDAVIATDEDVAGDAALAGTPVLAPTIDPAALRAIRTRRRELPSDDARGHHGVVCDNNGDRAEAVVERLARLAARPRRAPREVRRPSVVLEGGVRGAHSLGGVTRELARALATRDDVDLYLRDPEAPAIAIDDPILTGLLAKTAPAVPDVVIRTLHPAPLDRPRARRSIQMLYWEFGPPPIDWLHAAALATDEVWVSTTYVRDGFVAAGADPARLAIVPLGVDTARFNPSVAPCDLGDTAPGYRFLFVGGLAPRKGVDLLLHAYENAFTRADDVTLVIKDFGPGGPYPPNEVSEWADRLAADPTAPRVLRLTGSLGEEELPGLYTACDCLVHPYRAEAFGLTMIEAMACGRLVVAPDRGAARDFMDTETAMLVAAQRHELPSLTDPEGRALSGPPVYHEITVQDLVAALTGAAADPAAGGLIGARAAAVAKAHPWSRTAAVAAERIHAVLDESSAARWREAA